MRKDTIEYEMLEEKEYQYERRPRGLKEHWDAFFYDQKYYATGYRTKPVKVKKDISLGVNTQQIISELRYAVEEMFQTQIPEIMKAIANNFVTPILQVRDNAVSQIEKTISELEGIKISDVR